MQPIKVFLSSTYRDAEWRKVASQAISQLPGFTSVEVEESLATMRAPEQIVLDRIREADVFVVIIGISYGTKVPQREESFTEFEYQVAKEAGKPIVALMLAGEEAISTEHGHLVEKFAQRVESERPVARFQSIDDLRKQIVASLLKFKDRNFAPDFEITFDPDLSQDQVKRAFAALADYYRACGGIGLSVEFDQEEAEVREPIHV